MFLVIGSPTDKTFGRRAVCGAFETNALAEAAIEAAKVDIPRKRQIHEQWQARVQAALERFTPERVIYDSTLAHGVNRVFNEDQHRRARAEAGDEPECPQEFASFNVYEIAANEWSVRALP
jgi:citrate lyase gamma subunit